MKSFITLLVFVSTLAPVLASAAPASASPTLADGTWKLQGVYCPDGSKVTDKRFIWTDTAVIKGPRAAFYYTVSKNRRVFVGQIDQEKQTVGDQASGLSNTYEFVGPLLVLKLQAQPLASAPKICANDLFVQVYSRAK